MEEMEMAPPTPGYSSIMERQRIQITFMRGTLVVWCPDPRMADLEYGIVDCESATRPGCYFIRSEGNRLYCIHWSILMPTKSRLPKPEAAV